MRLFCAFGKLCGKLHSYRITVGFKLSWNHLEWIYVCIIAACQSYLFCIKLHILLICYILKRVVPFYKKSYLLIIVNSPHGNHINSRILPPGRCDHLPCHSDIYGRSLLPLRTFRVYWDIILYKHCLHHLIFRRLFLKRLDKIRQMPPIFFFQGINKGWHRRSVDACRKSHKNVFRLSTGLYFPWLCDIPYAYWKSPVILSLFFYPITLAAFAMTLPALCPFKYCPALFNAVL